MAFRNFKDRAKQHDIVALPLVLDRLQDFGFDGFQIGTETDTDALRNCLLMTDDKTANMLRFRPDTIAVKRGDMSLLFEIKSENNGYPNFSLEFRAYMAARDWNQLYRHLVYACVNLSVSPPEIVCCWANEIPSPNKVYVPQRWDYEQSIEWIRQQRPNIEILLRDYKPGIGSGTPFFLISKRARYLKPIDDFIMAQVLDRQLELAL